MQVLMLWELKVLLMNMLLLTFDNTGHFIYFIESIAMKHIEYILLYSVTKVYKTKARYQSLINNNIQMKHYKNNH